MLIESLALLCSSSDVASETSRDDNTAGPSETMLDSLKRLILTKLLPLAATIFGQNKVKLTW